MDISLDQALENSDKHQDNLGEDGSNDLMREVDVDDSLSHEDQSQISSDISGQQGDLQTYQFRTGDNGQGQVTYRVVQVGGPDDNPQATLSIVSPTGIQNILTQGGSSNTQQVAIVTNSFGETGEGTTSSAVSNGQVAKFAYFPSVSGSSAGGQELSSQTESGDHQGVAQGQFYVMMSPQDVLQTTQPSKHPLAPRNQFVQKIDAGRTVVVRDTTRRVQHNEVERRRRDKINTWIMKLSKLVPDCQGDHSKQGQSKGGILAKTCSYIHDLQSAHQQYEETLKEVERMQLDQEMLRIQLEEKKQENLILHQTLRSHGIQVDIKSVSSTNQ